MEEELEKADNQVLPDYLHSLHQLVNHLQVEDHYINLVQELLLFQLIILTQEILLSVLEL